MSTTDIERRLQALEDIEAIKKLKIRYCHCADAQDYPGFASLFTEDAVWEGGAFGHAEGRKTSKNSSAAFRRSRCHLHSITS